MIWRALLAFERRGARSRGIVGRAGAVTPIQRCGSALNTNVHFHALVAEGVFVAARDGAVRFVPAARPPTELEVGRLLAAVRRRIVRLVRRHGIVLDAARDDGADRDGLALDAIAGASVLGRVATGPRAGHLVLRLGADVSPPVVSTGGPRLVNELIVGVSVLLGTGDLAACSSIDGDGNGVVAVNELVAGVRSALDGCAAPNQP